MLYYIGRFIFFVLFKSLFRLKVYGSGNIPKNGGFIIASNHASNLDPEVIGVASPRPISFMAKEELFRNKLCGWVLRRLGAFPVKRESGDLSASKEALRRLKKSGGLLLFPQGGRRDTVEIKAAKAGVGMFSQRAKVPVIPAFIDGTAKAMPKGSKSPQLVKIRVYFGRPIYPQVSQEYEQIAKEVMSAISQISLLSQPK